MNAHASAVPAADELVVEELTQPPADDFLPGTCICWNDSALTA